MNTSLTKTESGHSMAYKRKTETVWGIFGFYDGEWEEVTTEISWRQAMVNVKLYRENEKGTSFKIKRYRIKVETV
jgi:hypothetical protein